MALLSNPACRLWAPLLILLAGCGSGESVSVRLVTGMENKAPFTNLMRKFAPTALTALGANTCKQRGIVAAVAPLGDPSLTETYPVDVTTNYFNAAYTIDSTWISTNLEFAPVSVPVPRGVPVEVGLFGALVAAEGVTVDGFCRERNATSVYDTTSVIGHKIINVDAATDVPVRVWVNAAVPAAQPAPTLAPPNSPECYNQADTNQNCPLLDFYALQCDDCHVNSSYVRLEYGIGRNTANRIVQWIDPAYLNNAQVNVPAIRPMKIGFYTPGNLATPVAEYVADRQSMSSNSQGVLAGIFTDTGGGEVPFHLFERPRSVTPTIGAFTALAVGGIGPDSGVIKWTGATNAAFIEIHYRMWGSTSAYTYSGTILPYPQHASLGLASSNSPSADYELILTATSPNVSAANYVTSTGIRYIPLGSFAPPTAFTTTPDSATTWKETVSFTPPPGSGNDSGSVTYYGDAINAGTGIQYTCTSRPGPASSIDCPGLPSGTYQFRLKAVNTHGGFTASALSTSVSF